MSQNTLVLEEVIENPTRTLFDQRYSPIRILFHGDDPDKDRTLPFVVEIQSHLSDLGDDPTVMSSSTFLWTEGNALSQATMISFRFSQRAMILVRTPTR